MDTNRSGGSHRRTDRRATAAQVTLLQWTEGVGEYLRLLVSERSPCLLECWSLLEPEIRAGISQLWHCVDGGRTLYVVTRVDQNPRELVICLAVGSGLQKFAPLFIERAREKGMPIRCHVESMATVRLCRRVGFRMAEFVLRVPNS